MAKTQITDVIVPSVFTPYIIERTAEKSAFFKSGIMGRVPEIEAELAAKGKKGGVINMPFWQDLSGADEVLSDSASLTPAKIAAAQDIAIMCMRGKAWSTNDLAHALAGDDPFSAIGELVSDYWARKLQTIAINVLTGAMAGTNMSGNVYDISGETGSAAYIDATSVIDATALLGDTQDDLAGIAVHGAVYAYMKKQDLIDFTHESEQGKPIPYYQNKRVIVDDNMPVDTGVYTTYLFGTGALGYGEVAPDYATEAFRSELAGDNVLINRKHLVIHPRGIAWQSSSMAGSSPTNAELATSSNWARAYEAKNIRIVQFKHKIG